MIWGTSDADKEKWFSWFAWYPVQLLDGRWAWLQRIERRMGYNRFHFHKYKAKK